MTDHVAVGVTTHTYLTMDKDNQLYFNFFML